MLRFVIFFPLGVYYVRFGEWPLNPLRLIGALLAAAHARPSAEPDADRALLQRLCEAPAPIVVAHHSVALGEPVLAGEAVQLRGVTRWAPRNYITGPISPRNLGRERAEVSKAGVAIGDRPVEVVWSDIVLDAEDLRRLAVLASEVTFIGTTRSPAIVEVDTPAKDQLVPDGIDGSDGIDGPDGIDGSDGIDGPPPDVWTPATAGDDAQSDATMRVPDANTIAAFDYRHAARRSTHDRVQRAGMVPEIAVGTPVRYVSGRRRLASAPPFDPRWWGEMIVLEIDRDRSGLVPRTPAAYMLARAVRVMLLGAFGDEGTATEAPPILRGRGSEPHCAIVPLSHVWGEHADGLIRGVALLPPHEARASDVYAQLRRLETGLRGCLEDVSGTARMEAGSQQRYVRVPGAGRLWLKIPDAAGARLASMREDLYLGPARSWLTVTPIVHSRWRKGGANALLDQVSADCAHVGLPAPVEIEWLRGPVIRGGAERVITTAAMPESWRSLLQGPRSHLRITFAEHVRGPVLIGRARHFGLGLCVPDKDGVAR